MDEILKRTRSRKSDEGSVKFSKRGVFSSVPSEDLFDDDGPVSGPGADVDDVDEDDDAEVVIWGKDQEDQKTLIAEIDEDGVVREYEVALKHLGLGLFHIILLVVNGVTLLSDAIEILAISFIFPVLIRNNDWDVGNKEQAILGSVIFVGMLFGSYVWGGLADVVGRRTTLIVALTISAVFGVLSAFSPWFWVFVIFRLFSGFGVGGSLPVVMPYSSEFVRNKYRGTYLSMQSVFWMIGRLLCGGTAWIMLSMDDYHLAGHEVRNWRVFLAISALPALVGAVMYFIFPESPRYLLEIGKQKEALEVLRRVYRLNHLCSKQEYPVKAIHLDGCQSNSLVSKKRKLKNVKVHCVEIFFRNVELFQRKYLRQTLLLLVILFCLSFGSYGVTLWYPTYVSELNAERSAAKLKMHCNSSSSITGSVDLSTFCDCSSTVFKDMTVSHLKLKNWKTSNVVFSNVTFYNVTFDGVLFNTAEFRDCKVSNSKLVGSYFNASKFIHVVFQSVSLSPDSVCISEDSSGEIVLESVSEDGASKTEMIYLSESSQQTENVGISTRCAAKKFPKIHCAANDFRVYRDSFFVSASSLPGSIASAIAVYYLRRNRWLAMSMFASTVSVFLLYVVTSEVFVVAMLCLFTAVSVPSWHDAGLIIAELYPTHLRSTANGAHLLMARIGAILGTNIFGLFVLVNPSVPILLVASLFFIGSIAAMGLPATTRNTLLK